MKKVIVKKEHVLCMKTVNKDMTAYNGFVWPKKGIVTCPDWKPTKQCGNGLHAALMGCGDGSRFKWEPDAVWIILSVPKKSIIDLDGKCKFPKCEVIYAGVRENAIGILQNVYGDKAYIGGTATAGDWGTATAGDCGTATAGYRGTLIIKYLDGNRYLFVTGYIGENGLKPNTAYILDDNHNFKEPEK